MQPRSLAPRLRGCASLEARTIPWTAARGTGRRLCALRVAAISAPDREDALKDKPRTPSPVAAASQLTFVDEDGQKIQVMPVDYGFRSGSGRLYQDAYGSVPANAWELGVANFKKELRALRQSVRYDSYKAISQAATPGPLGKAAYALGGSLRAGLARLDAWLEGKEALRPLPAPKDARDRGLTPEEMQLLDKVAALKLDDDKVIAREKQRVAAEGDVKAPAAVRAAFAALCFLLDRVYAGRPIQRFWVLETVARIPYFAFISALHLYESFGWWRAGAELRKVHFAEEWNELHHLQIMEALGGDRLWVDRFLAEHAALLYYWAVLIFYAASPSAAYAFSELVENHAVDTYAEFVEQNAPALQALPPPLVALNYYKAGDLYLFDAFQANWDARTLRRPPCNSLYDVFVNIRDDEVEHVKTMHACNHGKVVLKSEPSAVVDGIKRLDMGSDDSD